MWAISWAAVSIAAMTSGFFDARSPVTLRTYCTAAASTSSSVAGGSRPLSSVMFLHMRSTVDRTGRATMAG